MKATAKLHELGRKHRVVVAELKPRAEILRTELDTLRGAGERVSTLERERALPAATCSCSRAATSCA